MYITLQTIITFAAVIGAIVAVMKYYNKIYDLVKHQGTQDEQIKSIKEDQIVLTYGVLACLKGLQEQGCDGPVTEAIGNIEKHLNKEAHK